MIGDELRLRVAHRRDGARHGIVQVARRAVDEERGDDGDLKRLAVNDHRTFQNTPKWMNMVVDAYGLPRAEK